MNKAVAGQRNRAKKQTPKFFLLLWAVFLGYALWVFVTQQIEIEARKSALAQLDGKIAAQAAAQAELERKKELADTPEHLEQIARNELDYARPDEIVIYDATLKK